MCSFFANLQGLLQSKEVVCMTSKFLWGALFIGCLFFAGSVYAQSNDEIDQEIKDLKAASNSPQVSEELLKPEGVSIKLTAEGWQIFSIGEGAYDFNDPQDIQAAYKEGQLRAKANLAKFFDEKVETEEFMNILNEKVRELDKGKDSSVSMKTARTIAENVKNSADKILRGVVVLKTIKKPQGDGSGIIQVKVGISQKTLNAAKQISHRMEDDSNIEIGSNSEANDIEIRTSDTDF